MATPSDDYIVNVTIEDDDTGADGPVATTVTVNNVAPAITAVGDVIDEGGTATVSGTITDPGVEDTFTMTIDWGDGLALDVVNLPAGSTSYSQARAFTDDNPTGTSSDIHNVSVTIEDDDAAPTVSEQIVFVTSRHGPGFNNELYSINLDGTDEERIQGSEAHESSQDRYRLRSRW